MACGNSTGCASTHKQQQMQDKEWAANRNKEKVLLSGNASAIYSLHIILQRRVVRARFKE
jgi:hypothetical protein